jgi:BirA family biotin operon repressor/biotin-[acetyl-CoA-carboxylase] ligase
MFHQPLNLTTLNSLLDTQVIGRAAGWANEVFDSIESTNNRAIELANKSAPEGVIVAARQQTAGKGRLGRVWVSPPDSGLYISFILRSNLARPMVPIMSFAAGTAAVEAIEETAGIRVGLKWVNDIVFGGRKLGGILAEMTDGGNAVIIGIGINLKQPDSEPWPPEVAAVATTIESISNAPIDANHLAAALAKRLEIRYKQLENGDLPGSIDRWRQFCVTLGKPIRATVGDRVIEGTATDVASDGALIVTLVNGELTALHAGDVSIRNADGSYS